MDEEIIFLQVSDKISKERMEDITEWMKTNMPKGYKFVLGNMFHALSTDELELFYRKLDIILHGQKVEVFNEKV